jgi:branched-chain amino acid aminotransferase
MRIETTRSASAASDARVAEVLADPGFGAHFTDHMVAAQWTKSGGWGDAALGAYAPITIEPAAAVFHYAQEVFEGMKAYRWEDGSIWTFRPEDNARRMASSCRRLALPELSVDDFVKAVDALIEIDQRWVPEAAAERTLYVRPFMFASEAVLGVRPSSQVTFMVIACPAGSYFAHGVQPLTLWLSTEYSRAGRGGMGAAKAGGNYASSLIAQQQAIAQGCDQVVFLDAESETSVEELGGMNIYFVYADGRLVTPPTGGTILEGITRSSVMELAGKLGHQVEERRMTIDEWRDGVESGDIAEVFACGTAAVVTPIGSLKWASGEGVAHTRPIAEPGEVTMKLRKALVDIQYGRAEDTFGWMHRVC